MSLTVLVDYDSGNLHSAQKAFQRMAIETGAGSVLVSSRPEDVARADRIVLPGDGAFPSCRRALGSYGGLFEAIEEAVTVKARPFLGICVGMQVLFETGVEHGVVTQGLGEWPGTVERLTADVLPHMGWNDVKPKPGSPLFAGLESDARFYFLHSYYFACDEPSHVAAVAAYGFDFSCAVSAGNVYGVQFHPEKSHHFGAQLLKNFAEL